MKILFITLGSRGDVQPHIAICKALAERGHNVLLAAPPENKDFIEGHGVEFHPIGSSFKDFVKAHPFEVSLRLAVKLTRQMRSQIPLYFKTLHEICRGRDVIFSSGITMGTSATVAEYLGIKSRYFICIPQIIPADSYSPPFFNTKSLPRVINRSAWWFLERMLFVTYGGLINKERKRLGLGKVLNLWAMEVGSRPVIACDKAIAPMADDTYFDFVQTAYPHLAFDESFDPPLGPDIEAFLSSGTRPIYAGFGSMPNHDPEKTTTTILEAARIAGTRVIVSKGWAGLEGQSSKDVLFIGEAPHAKLFPLMSAVVHHGGAGTTATTARAGVPHIIFPHIFDQFFWAERIVELGVGTAILKKKHFTADRLAAAIKEATDEGCRERATALALEISKTDGVGEFIRYFEREFE